MSKTRKFVSQIGDFFEVIGSAAAVASAVDTGRTPRARDLKKLGIAPDSFRSINQF